MAEPSRQLPPANINPLAVLVVIGVSFLILVSIMFYHAIYGERTWPTPAIEASHGDSILVLRTVHDSHTFDTVSVDEKATVFISHQIQSSNIGGATFQLTATQWSAIDQLRVQWCRDARRQPTVSPITLPYYDVAVRCPNVFGIDVTRVVPMQLAPDTLPPVLRDLADRAVQP